MLPEMARNCARQIGEHLLAAGVPGVEAIEHGARPQRRDERIDFYPRDQEAVDQSDQRAHQQHGDRPPPTRQTLALQADRQNLRNAEIEAGGEIEMVGGHRNEHGQRQQRLHGFVVEDRPDVEEGRESVGLQHRKDDQQQDEQDSNPQTEMARVIAGPAGAAKR